MNEDLRLEYKQHEDGYYVAISGGVAIDTSDDLHTLMARNEDPVLVCGNYYPWAEAQAIAEDCRLAQEAEEDYFNTYTAFDGRTGRDYTQNKSLQHPFPIAFKHFHQTIGLDPEEAHLLACGENRFDLISDDFDNEKRVYASKFYDWLLNEDYWESSGEWQDGQILESSILSVISEFWSRDELHPLYPLLQKIDPEEEIPDLNDLFN